jgi:hypothetical protein
MHMRGIGDGIWPNFQEKSEVSDFSSRDDMKRQPGERFFEDTDDFFRGNSCCFGWFWPTHLDPWF